VKHNEQECNRTYKPYSRKGVFCERLRYYWQSGELRACAFPEDVEKTYDRSIKKFIETY